jgi:hypothetical protein
MGFSFMSGLAGFAEARGLVLDEKREANTRMLERHMSEGAEHLKDLRAKQTSRREAFDADRGSLAAMGISEENQARVMQGSVASRARTIVNLGKQRDTAEARGLTPNEAFMNSFFARPNRPAGINETDDTDSNTSVVPPGTVPDTVRSMNDSRLAAAGTIQGEAGAAPQHKGLGALFGKAKPLAYAGDGRTLTNDQGRGTASDVSDPTAGIEYSKTLSQIDKNTATKPYPETMLKSAQASAIGSISSRYSGVGSSFDINSNPIFTGIAEDAVNQQFFSSILPTIRKLQYTLDDTGNIMHPIRSEQVALDMFDAAGRAQNAIDEGKAPNKNDLDSLRRWESLMPKGVKFLAPTLPSGNPTKVVVDPQARAAVPLPDEPQVTPKKQLTFSDLKPAQQAEGRAAKTPTDKRAFRTKYDLDRDDPLGGK